LIRVAVLIAAVVVIGLLASSNPPGVAGATSGDTEFYGRVTDIPATCGLVCGSPTAWDVRVDGIVSGNASNSTVYLVTYSCPSLDYPCSSPCNQGNVADIKVGDEIHVHVRGRQPPAGWSVLDACHAGDATSKCNAHEPNDLNTCNLKTGDLVVIHKDDPLYVALHTLFDGAYWTHVGIYNGDGTITESYPHGPGDVHPG
jgi:hypothetical protein